jgi:DNA polymerase III delta prime subunit
MATVGEAVATLEQHLLVARMRELEVFRTWLCSYPPPVELLNLSGPPGVGKTMLMRAFAREARILGRRVASVDGHSGQVSGPEFIRALNDDRPADLEELVARLNRERSLVLIDTFEQLEHLTTFLQAELLPRLDTGVKVVIAGRRPLVLTWSRADAWPKIVRLLSLGGFTERQSHAYLVQRGINRHDLIDQIVTATAGNPLALSLAADIVTQLDVSDFAADPQWHLAARPLVRRLLSETAGDPSLITAVEACSVIRFFDEATLSAVMAKEDVSVAFDRLCRLSVIKPAAYGLMLDDNVRTIIATDLRWRRPRHYQLLRQRALEYFKERLRTSPDIERAWLIVECFFLLDNPILRKIFFGLESLSHLTVEPAVDVDRETVIELYSEGRPRPSRFSADAQLLSDVFGYPHARVRMASNVDGDPIGFSMVLPVCTESVAILKRHPVHADLVNSFFAPAGREILATNASDATVYYLLPIVARGEDTGAARRALFRDLAAIFGLNGTYLCTSRDPLMERLLSEFAFELVVESHRTNTAAKGWALDLTRVGFEGWIQAVIDGSQVKSLPANGELQTEILSALIHWDDAAWLAVNCPLTSAGVAMAERADKTRQTIREALSRARAERPGSSQKALRAIELAYMNRSASHKQAMRSLSVSKATFYRLCKRGVGTLTEYAGGYVGLRSRPDVRP